MEAKPIGARLRLMDQKLAKVRVQSEKAEQQVAEAQAALREAEEKLQQARSRKVDLAGQLQELEIQRKSMVQHEGQP
eukprot:5373798-Lingulodinium_polyedra.AAC.1